MIMIDDLDFGVTVKGFAPGQRLSARYSLNRTLGEGGMGVVWLVNDDELKRDIAMKFLPEMVVRDREAIADLKRETKRSLELTHANIVRIYDFIQDARWAGISMEYVDGDTLSALKIEEPGGCFDVSKISAWIEQLCLALSYAHDDAFVVHRDLKPSNLMVTKAGKLKVADFGIAGTLTESMSRVTVQRSSGGTLVYMSPQQAMGEQPSVTDDIYSVGATIYDLLTGKPPFYSGEIMTQLREKQATPLTERRARLNITGKEPIPPHWEAVVLACLEKDPSRRPRSVKELAERFFDESSAKTKTTISFPTLPNTAAVTQKLKSLHTLPNAKWWLAVAAGGAGIVALAYFGGNKPEPKKPELPAAATGSTAPSAGPTQTTKTPTVATEVLPAPAHPSQGATERPVAASATAPVIPSLVPAADSSRAVSEFEGLEPSNLLRRAEAGEAAAQGLAALSYQLGYKLPEDFALANQWAKKAADAGDPIGQFILATLYASGQGTAPDSDAAAELAKKAFPQLAQAAAQRPVAANYCLAVAYRDGLGTGQNLPKALALFDKEAAWGSAPGQYGAGGMIAQGLGASPDPAKASEYFQKAANQALAESMVSMAQAYRNGQGVPKDEQKAGEFWRLAAERGNAAAQLAAAQAYAQGMGGVKDLTKARELYRKAAEQGDPAAKYALGQLYAAGSGSARDPKKAAEFYQQAADLGNAAAQASLALLYATGEGVPKNAQKAAEFYGKVKSQSSSASDADRAFLQTLEKEGADVAGVSIGALDPGLVGTWESGAKSLARAKRPHWQIAKNGQYSLTGSDTDSGAVTASEGHLRQLSTEGNAWVDLAYVVRGETLLTYGPQELTEWHKTSSEPSSEKKKVATRTHEAPKTNTIHKIGNTIKHILGF